MRGVLVTATDTGVGKTVVAAAICAALAARGERVAAWKPVVTGTDEPEPGVPMDHVLLAACTGQEPSAVTARTFGPAVSPHLAAANAPLDPAELEAAAREAAPGDGWLVAEGVGGLLVPLTDAGYDIRALARALGLPVVIAARPGLGTINHTLLTLEAARAAELDVRGVVLTPWPGEPSAMERSNARDDRRAGRRRGLLPAARPGARAGRAGRGRRGPPDRRLARRGPPRLSARSTSGRARTRPLARSAQRAAVAPAACGSARSTATRARASLRQRPGATPCSRLKAAAKANSFA